MSGFRHLASSVALIGALALSGCGDDAQPPTASGSPAPATPSPTASSASPSPSATASQASAATLPTDCSKLGTTVSYQATVGDMTLQSDGEGFVRPAPQGATLALGCDWIVGDATGALLLVSTADPAAVQTAVKGLPAQGYTCQQSEDFGAQFCDLGGSAKDTEELVVARDGVWIYLSTANRNGRAFLADIVQGIFGSS